MLDILLTIILVLLFIAVMNKLDTKKPPAKPMPRGSSELPPPMPGPWATERPEKPQQPAFEIPPIQGAPREGSEVYREPGTVQAEMQEQQQRDRLERQRDRAYIQEQRALEARERTREREAYEAQAHLKKIQPLPVPRLNTPAMQAEALRQAVIYAEVLGAPKALKNTRWHR